MSFSPPQAHSPTKRSWAHKYIPKELPDDPGHPAQIALRTYAVSLSLSLGPALLPFIIGLFSGRRKATGQGRSLKDVLKRELGPNGFAFAITVAVGGGAALQRVWQLLEDNDDQDYSEDEVDSPAESLAEDESPGANILQRSDTYQKLRKWISSQEVASSRKAFISNIVSSTIAIILLQGRAASRRTRPRSPKNIDIPLTMPIDTNATRSGPSPTLDLTLLLLVRAIDATIQSLVFKRSETYWSRSRNLSTIDVLGENGAVLLSQAGAVEAQQKKEEGTRWRQKMTTGIDAFIFWACSARYVDIQTMITCWANQFSNIESCIVSFMSLEGATSSASEKDTALL